VGSRFRGYGYGPARRCEFHKDHWNKATGIITGNQKAFLSLKAMAKEAEIMESFMVVTLFLGYLLVWRLKKHTMLRHAGLDPEVIYDDSRPTQKFFAALSRVLSVGIVLLIVFHGAGFKNVYAFDQISFIDSDTVNIIGFILGLGGLLLCWMAQREMGHSWRVGIDKQNKTALVTSGVFQKIRNPTYTGLFLICTGSLLIYPTLSFIVWVIAFYISIEFQVRIEEEFLADSHGESYNRYFHSTKRYIPYLY
jgi:protein-S-isoprenylcysteine O-methyltransferase Ste14